MKRITGLLIIVIGAVIGVAILQQAPVSQTSTLVDQVIAPQSSAAPGSPPWEIGQALPSHEKTQVLSHDNKTILHLKLREWLSAQALDSEEDQDRLLKELLALLTDDNVAEIVQSLSAEELDTPFTIAALHRWMQVNPAKATGWAASRAEGAEGLLTAAAAEDWVKNKSELFAYVDQLPNSDGKERFLSAAGLELSMKDPHGAIDLAQRMRPGAAQTNLLQAVVCDWISLEPNAALNWIIDVHQPELREQLTVAAAKSYALTEPNLAASWLISTVRSPEVMKEAVLNIVETWGAKDPETAAKWVTTTLDGETRKAAVDIISGHWMKSNSQAATTWIQSLSNPGT